MVKKKLALRRTKEVLLVVSPTLNRAKNRLGDTFRQYRLSIKTSVIGFANAISASRGGETNVGDPEESIHPRKNPAGPDSDCFPACR